MGYKTLMQKLENLNCDLIEDIPEFTSTLYNLYLKNDSKTAKKLTDSLAKYFFRINKNFFKKTGYTGAFWSAREELDQYSGEADLEYGFKTFANEIWNIQNFYRTAVNYSQKDIFSLN